MARPVWSEMRNGRRHLTLRGKAVIGEESAERDATIVVTQKYTQAGRDYLPTLKEWDMTVESTVTPDPHAVVNMKFRGEGLELSGSVFLSRMDGYKVRYAGTGTLKGLQEAGLVLPR